MRKVFAASLFLGLASICQATFIQCALPQADVVVNSTGSSAVFTCTPGGSGASANVDGDGLLVTQIRLRISGTFQENAGPAGQTYSVLYSSINTGATLGTGSFTIGALNCTATGVASNEGQALGACAAISSFAAAAGTPDSIPGFSVTVTGGSGSNPLPFNGSASVSYEVTTTTPTIPDPEVPEPATYSMMGAGLIGLFCVRRRT
jgi:hypothetical protein